MIKAGEMASKKILELKVSLGKMRKSKEAEMLAENFGDWRKVCIWSWGLPRHYL